MSFILEMWKNDEVSYTPKGKKGTEILDLPLCYFVYDLEDFSLFPVKDGIFDADSIENIIENMDLNIHLEQPVGGQYFEAGDSVEELYEALNCYVQEETN